MWQCRLNQHFSDVGREVNVSFLALSTSHLTPQISHVTHTPLHHMLHDSIPDFAQYTLHTRQTSHSTLHCSHLPLTPPLFHLASSTSNLTVSHRSPQVSRLTPHTSHLTPQTSQFTLHCTHRIFHWNSLPHC